MVNLDEGETTRKGALLYGAIFSLVISVIVCLGIGWVLDRWLGTGPWLLVSGIVFGAVVGFYQFIRLVSRIS